MGGNLRGSSAHWHAPRLRVSWPGELVRSNLGPPAAGNSEGGVALRRLAAECGSRRIVGGPVPTCSPAGWPRSRPHWQAAWSLDAPNGTQAAAACHWQWSPTRRILALGDGGLGTAPDFGVPAPSPGKLESGATVLAPFNASSLPVDPSFQFPSRIPESDSTSSSCIERLQVPPRSLSLSIRVAQSPSQCTNSRQCFAFQRNDRQWPVLLTQHWHRSNGRDQSSPPP